MCQSIIYMERCIETIEEFIEVFPDKAYLVKDRDLDVCLCGLDIKEIFKEKVVQGLDSFEFIYKE